MKVTYRIAHNEHSGTYTFVEVYEHENGTFSILDSVAPETADLSHLRWETEMMLQAFDKPVIER